MAEVAEREKDLLDAIAAKLKERGLFVPDGNYELLVVGGPQPPGTQDARGRQTQHFIVEISEPPAGGQ